VRSGSGPPQSYCFVSNGVPSSLDSAKFTRKPIAPVRSSRSRKALRHYPLVIRRKSGQYLQKETRVHHAHVIVPRLCATSQSPSKAKFVERPFQTPE
jgi:hypothetical protein